MIVAALLLLSSDLVARVRVEPARAGPARVEIARVEIGEPVQVVLEVEHEAGVSVRLPKTGVVVDPSWVVLDEPRIVRTPSLTRATWRVCSLEPGERRLPAIALEIEEGGAKRTVEAVAETLSVQPALADGEDAPRPMTGFRPVPADAVGAPRWPWIASVALALAIAGGLAWRRLRRRALPAAPPTPLARLSALERLAAADPEAARPVVYGVSRLLRESIDAWLAEPRAALTDAAWVARIEADERVPLGVRSTTARLLRDAEGVKYALVVPTRFALTEVLADARNGLEALASAPPSSPLPDRAPGLEAAA